MKRLIIVLLLSSRAHAGPSEVIFPPQKIVLNFSHKVHLAKGVECDFCHDRAGGSRLSSDDLLPKEEVCETCHPIDRARPLGDGKKATACATCHPGWTEGAAVQVHVIPSPNVKFDHKAHLDRSIPCARCHGDLKDVALATRAQLPSMPLCLGCHDSRKGKLHAGSRCTTCHLPSREGTLETRFASGVLKPSGALKGDTHGLSFRTQHAAVARDEERYCMSCHTQRYCMTCHDGVVKPLDFHGNDYVSRHSVDARRNDPNCSACHRAQTFCLGCHERLGITDLRTSIESAFSPLTTRRFHPAGWADDRATGQPSHHAWQAQRNLRQCAACHRQETCLECHGARDGIGAQGKMQVNPHPPDWRGGQRCRALADRNQRMCLRCHAHGDPQLSCE
jgi:hypothetical protein